MTEIDKRREASAQHGSLLHTLEGLPYFLTTPSSGTPGRALRLLRGLGGLDQKTKFLILKK
jgi:hypothetical protein